MKTERERNRSYPELISRTQRLRRAAALRKGTPQEDITAKEIEEVVLSMTDETDKVQAAAAISLNLNLEDRLGMEALRHTDARNGRVLRPQHSSLLHPTSYDKRHLQTMFRETCDSER